MQRKRPPQPKRPTAPLQIWERRAVTEPSTDEQLDSDRNLQILLGHWQHIVDAKGLRESRWHHELAALQAFVAGLSRLDRSRLHDALWLALEMAEIQADFEFGAIVDARRRSADALALKRHTGTPKHSPQVYAHAIATAGSDKAAARALGVSVRTISNYKRKKYTKR